MSKRQQSARERAARERVERVNKALEYMPQAKAAKERQQQTLAKRKRDKLTAPRASSTDPQVRVMKMPDGGFRPAHNVELATDGASGVIVGVDVVNTGDAGPAAPMEAQVAQRTGQHPKAYLMDGAFASRADITTLEERDVTVYAPVRLPRNKPEEERYEPRSQDGPAVVRWRERLATQQAQVLYKERGATAEWANAKVLKHGMSRFTVRGLGNAPTVMLLVAVAHNLTRWIALTT